MMLPQATDIYKRLLLESRDDLALLVAEFSYAKLQVARPCDTRPTIARP